MRESFGKIYRYFTGEELQKLQKIADLEIRALAIVGRVYAEKLDKSGQAETGHFVRIAKRMKTPEGKTVALLHDIVEDDYLLFWDLLPLFPENIIKSLQILCRDKAKYPNYDDYITSIIRSNDILAIEVKLCDISDNLSPKRVLELSKDKQVKAYNKYTKALPRIYDAYKNLINDNAIIRRRIKND